MKNGRFSTILLVLVMTVVDLSGQKSKNKYHENKIEQLELRLEKCEQIRSIPSCSERDTRRIK